MLSSYFKNSNNQIQPTTTKTATVVSLVAFGCLYIANTLYQWSLEGSVDIDWLHHHLPLLGVYLVCSSIFYYIGYFVLLKLCINRWNYNSEKPTHHTLLTTPNASKLVFLLKSDYGFTIPALVLFFSFLFTLSSLTISCDGVSFQRHGKLNLSILAFILLIYLLLTALFYFVVSLNYLSVGKLLSILAISLFIVFFNITNSRSNAFYQWSTGIDSNLIEFGNGGSTSCAIKEPLVSSFPLSTFLPKLFTYLTNGESTRCVARQKPFSSFDPDGKLTINCPKGVQASYILTPDFFKGNHYLSYKDMNQLIETYAPFERKYNYTKPVIVRDETIVAKCGERSQVHTRNFKKASAQERASHFNRPTLPNENIHIMDQQIKTKPIDIMLLTINGLSRGHFKRALPKTFSTIQAIQGNGKKTSKVYQFSKYHSLWGDSYFNTLSMYTGYNAVRYSEKDIDVKGKSGYAHKWETNPMYYQSFRTDSYVNSWVHGTCADWFTKHLGKTGPTRMDHEFVLPFCSSQVLTPVNSTENYNNNTQNNYPFHIPKRCIDGKHTHSYIFDYLTQFWDNYHDVGKISTVTLMDTFQGTLDINDYVDSQFNTFIKSMQRGHLNDTALFIVGDNGSSLKNYYFNGDDLDQLEISMPALYIILPTWFIDRHPSVNEILKINENKLFTPLQLYYTLRAFSRYAEFGGIDVEDPENDKNIPKGLLDPIQSNITCSDTSIRHDFCQCK